MQRIKISIPRSGCCLGAAPFREQQGEGWGHSRTHCCPCISERDSSLCRSPQCISEQLGSARDPAHPVNPGRCSKALPSLLPRQQIPTFPGPRGGAHPAPQLGQSVSDLGRTEPKGLLALPGGMGPQVPRGDAQHLPCFGSTFKPKDEITRTDPTAAFVLFL